MTEFPLDAKCLCGHVLAAHERDGGWCKVCMPYYESDDDICGFFKPLLAPFNGSASAEREAYERAMAEGRDAS